MFADGNGRLSLAEKRGDDFKADVWMQQPFMVAAHRVIESGEPLAVFGREELPPGIKSFPAEVGAIVAFPLKTLTYTIGVLSLVRLDGGEPFSNLDVEHLNVLASQASISIEIVEVFFTVMKKTGAHQP